MNVEMTEWPTEHDFIECKRRALVTAGKLKVITKPDSMWIFKILRARHSPIRRLRFSFDIIDVPYWVSVHLCRHIHAQPYVKSQRNDRQTEYNRNSAPQDALVNMIWDMNAEELMNVANKRLCRKASPETRAVVEEMCRQVIEKCPEFEAFLVPMCAYVGECKEMYPCDAER